MSDTQPSIEELLKLYRAGKLPAEQKALLEQWYHFLEYDTTRFTDEDQLRQMQSDSWKAIAGSRQKRSTRFFGTRYRWAVAAAAIFLLAISAWWLLADHKPKAGQAALVAGTILPAGDKAVLTLADGRQVVLEQVQNGAVAAENGSTIVKLGNGELAYQQGSLAKGAAGHSFNTLTIPRGGHYTVRLPDGTMVWMNSASSLKYPTVFTGAERVVELTGEAYFEVAANAKMPFKVNTRQVTVDVLGTEFNIHAYPDEPSVTTTLVEGSVRVSNQVQAGGRSAVLTPGWQLVRNDNSFLTRKANLKQVLAWKNGLFMFEDMTLAEILREISRWYDIDIDMRITPNEARYGGVIKRNSTLEKILVLLEQNGGAYHFKTEGRKVIVLP